MEYAKIKSYSYLHRRRQSYASAGSCLISVAIKGVGPSSLFTSWFSFGGDSAATLDRLVSGKGGAASASCIRVSVAESLLPPCEPPCLRGRRAVPVELLPLRVRSSPARRGSRPSGSGVGVVLREEEREWEPERSWSSRLRCFSFRRSTEGFSLSASFSRSS